MGSEPEPDYLSFLRDEDKCQFVELRKMFTSEDYNFSDQNPFFEIMSIIKDFSIRNNEDDARRCAVCGLCWLKTSLGVNECHLTYLTGQPKVTIRNELTRLNYMPTLFTNEIILKIPYLEGNIPELRLWSFRKNPSGTQLAVSMARKAFKTQSPKPHTPSELLFQKNWSYEDFETYLSDSPANPMKMGDEFFDDVFLLPFSDWKKNQPSSDVSILPPF